MAVHVAEAALNVLTQENVVITKAIKGKGWFVYAISAIVAGDNDALSDDLVRPNWERLKEVFSLARDTGFARFSRRGWWTLEHPILGTVQWKEGVNFRTVQPYLYVRVNGKPLSLEGLK